MSSGKYNIELNTDQSIEDLIKEMKNEVLKGIKAKAQVYCFDFERDIPISGKQIQWMDEFSVVH